MKKIGRTIFLLLMFSCSNDYLNTSLLDSIPSAKYYSNEIFKGDYLRLYGRWQFSYIYADAGIVAGPGKIGPTYDYLEIKRYGIYGKIKDNIVIESGKIVVTKQDNSQLQIKFEPEDKELPVYWYDVSFYPKDSLMMRDASVGCGVEYNEYSKEN